MSDPARDAETHRTVEAIGAYCKVLDLFLKATREGLLPAKDSREGHTREEAWAGLNREVSFLRFLREGDPQVE